MALTIFLDESGGLAEGYEWERFVPSVSEDEEEGENVDDT